ncbi:phytanoyl-CoA dioxygenase family protein [bacterium]|nr:phytanoyl-CoA dioxygenase family protein [bacterium]
MGDYPVLYQHLSIGQMQASWNVRQLPKIVEIFSHFWGCENEELLVSFDGASFSPPPEVTNRGWGDRDKSWLHTDQSFMRNGLECIQSWVTALDVNEDDATLTFMEGSNKYHKEFAKKFNITKESPLKDRSDWYVVGEKGEQFYLDKGCEYKKIKCPKGSLVFWDSRTIHSGSKAMKNRKHPNFRAVIYLCYTPRNGKSSSNVKSTSVKDDVFDLKPLICSDANIRKKQKAFKEIRSTNHHPCKIKLFSKEPYMRGKKLPKITPIEQPRLTKLGKILAGF